MKKFKYKKNPKNKRLALNPIHDFLWRYYGKPKKFKYEFPSSLGGDIIDLINQDKHKSKCVNGTWKYSYIDWDIIKLLRSTIKEPIPIVDVAQVVKDIFRNRLYLDNNQCEC